MRLSTFVFSAVINCILPLAPAKAQQTNDPIVMSEAWYSCKEKSDCVVIDTPYCPEVISKQYTSIAAEYFKQRYNRSSHCYMRKAELKALPTRAVCEDGLCTVSPGVAKWERPRDYWYSCHSKDNCALAKGSCCPVVAANKHYVDIVQQHEEYSKHSQACVCQMTEEQAKTAEARRDCDLIGNCFPHRTDCNQGKVGKQRGRGGQGG